MSMNCLMVGLSEAQAAKLRARPELVPALLEITQVEALVAEAKTQLPKAAWPAVEKQLRAREPATPELGAVGPTLDLQKSWHILHYLLTGHPGAATAPGDLLLSGAPLGEDLGYGPARFHDARAVRAADAFLQPLDVAKLDARLDLAKMRALNIYGLPFPGGAEDLNDVRREVAWAFPALKSFVRARASAGEGLLTWIA